MIDNNIKTYSTDTVDKIAVRQPVGKWAVNGSLWFTVYNKPNWLHRLITRLLLGWKWEDRK